MAEKKYDDKTTEFRVIKKGIFKRKVELLDDNEFKALEDTREFKIQSNGNTVERINSKPAKGLSSSMVKKRIEEGHINKEKKKFGNTYLKIIVKNVFTYLNILLFFILAMLIVAGCTKISNYFFMLIIGSNLVIGIVQEIRAKKIVDKLSLTTKSKVTVVRDSKEEQIDVEELVLDDIYKLSLGAKIPTDSKVVEGNVEVNESLLTGESLPVKKQIGDLLFAGSFISSGSCTCRAERVGDENYITKLQQQAKKEKKNNSIILKALNLLIGVISLLVVPFALFNFFISWSRIGWINDWTQISSIIMKTASSMVAMIPTGLYLTTSVSLVVSVIALAKRKTLVQDNYAIEMLARTNVLCLDKTGTITDGTMVVVKEKEINKSKVNPDVVVADLLDAFEFKNDTALAILKKHAATHSLSIVSTLPFSSSRKKSAVKFKEGTFVLGAPEFVLTKEDPIVKEFEEYTKQGYRVILLAEADDLKGEEIIGKIKPLQAYVIKDHVREEAPATLKWFMDNDVEVKIISGDNPLTVSVIAKEAGVKNADKYISLEGLTLEEVSKAATEYTVFGRVAPEQKATLVTALKKAGKTVSMTGDGVNDILALKRADCSIAMASGSEAARNVSSLVLLDSNFACLPKVVSEGRRVINNITEVASLFLMKTIFAIILTLSTLYPFDPQNLLLLEIFGSGFASFLLALQPNDNPIKEGFITNVFSKALPGGLSYAIVIIISVLMLNHQAFGLTNTHLKTICGIMITLSSLVTLFYHCLPLNKNRVVVYASMCFMTILVIAIPALAYKVCGFETTSLSWQEWLFTFIMFALTSVLFIIFMFVYREVRKVIRRKRQA